MKIYKITYNKESVNYSDNYMDALEQFKAFLDDAQFDDDLSLTIVEMTEEEFTAVQ